MAISAAQRRKLPSKSFALPGKGTGPGGKGPGSYPIDTSGRARNALARGAQHASPEQLATIKRKVHAKFPGIGARQQGGPVGRSLQPLAGSAAALARAAFERSRREAIAPAPDERGRTGDRGRYDADAYPGYRKGGRVKPRQAGGPVESEHEEREDKLIKQLEEVQEKEKKGMQRRQFGGPVGGKPFAAITAMKKKKNPMASSIGARGLRDSGPSYPKQAASYVR
jgi:hypothetical protein